MNKSVRKVLQTMNLTFKRKQHGCSHSTYKKMLIFKKGFCQNFHLVTLYEPLISKHRGGLLKNHMECYKNRPIWSFQSIPGVFEREFYGTAILYKMKPTNYANAYVCMYVCLYVKKCQPIKFD